MFEDWDWLKENITAAVTGFFSVMVAVIAAAAKLLADRRQRTDAKDRQDKIDHDKARVVELDGNAAQAADLTARFRMLMEGYENRIKDLTVEMQGLKIDLQAVRTLYENRLTICSTCSHYATHAARRLDARPSP